MTDKKGWLGPYAPTDRHADQTTLQELVRLRKVNEKYRWQPIETAPKIDERRILVVWLGHVQIASWNDEVSKWQEDRYGDFTVHDDEVTHWMPLPEGPK